MNSIFWTSKLKRAKQGDFICFSKKADERMGGSGIWFFRLVAKGGDIVHIKEGVVYVNGKNFDNGRVLMHMYKADRAQLAVLAAKETDIAQHIRILSEEKGIINVADDVKAKYAKGMMPYTLPPSQQDEYLFSAFDKQWNADHFGPVKVPPECYFVLGDNRNNALDSRYIGFIPEADVVGTVLGDH